MLFSFSVVVLGVTFLAWNANAESESINLYSSNEASDSNNKQSTDKRVDIYVTSLNDGFGNCSSFSTTCSLRSAMLGCSKLKTQVNTSCNVHLPIASILNLRSEDYDPLEFHLSNINSSFTLTILGYGSTIMCQSLGPCTSRFLSVLYSHKSNGFASLKMYNLTISGFGHGTNSISGGGLYLEDLSHSIFHYVSFINNSALYGGAIAINDSNNIIMNNCYFYKNSGSYGGGIYMKNSRNIQIMNTIGEMNSVSISGGVVYLDSCISIEYNNMTLINNSALFTGGAISLEENNSNIKIKNSNIIGNFAKTNGGGINIGINNFNINIINCNLNLNSATIGGGIYLNLNNYNITLISSTILKNSVEMDGAGLFIGDTNYNIIISKNSILYNNAKNNGAGIGLNNKNHHIQIINNIIKYNFAKINGGGIFFNDYNFNILINNNIMISNQGGSGGGINFQIYNYNIIISYNTIDYNYAITHNGGAIFISDHNYNISIYNCTLNHNIANLDGGAIHIENHNSKFLLSSNTFLNNSADFGDGGAIYINEYNEYITLYYCILEKNTAAFFGGSLHFERENHFTIIRSSKFISNEALFGGAMLVEFLNTYLYIISSYFEKNKAAFGGAIQINQLNSNIFFKKSIFVSNLGYSGNGGAILVNDYNSHIYIDNNLFSSNKVTINGGGICFSSFNDIIIISNSKFLSNHAQEGGGLALSVKATNVTIQSCLFQRNFAEKDGGALYIDYETKYIKIKDVEFIDNTANADGGGVNFGVYNSFISFERCTFRNNHAVDGGGVCIGTSNGKISFENSYNIFHNNTAHGSGGGIYIGYNNKVDIKSVTFHENSIHDENGGAIYIGKLNHIYIKSCNFTSNSADEGSGGAIYLQEENSFSLSYSIFIRNQAAISGALTFNNHNRNSSIKHCDFISNSATYGGALSVTANEGIYIRDCHFYSNYAEINGGSIFIRNSNKITMKRIRVIKSTAAGTAGGGAGGGSGGGLYMMSATYVQITSSFFTENSAYSKGGAMLISSGSFVTIDRCLFYDGKAMLGSGIYLSKTSPAITINGGIFQNNSAYVSGTVFWESEGMSEPLGLQGCVWKDNTAKYGSHFATDSFRLTSPRIVFINRNSNSLYLPVVNVTILDYYDQKVVTDNTGTVSVSLESSVGCNLSPAFLKGALAVRFSNGTAIFDSISTTCLPEGSLSLRFTSTSLNESSETIFHFPTFSPTIHPTALPTVNTHDFLSAPATTIGLSIGGSVLFCILVFGILWRCLFSRKAIHTREKKKRLEKLPIHSMLLGYNRNRIDNEELLQLIRSYPEYAVEKDYDGNTALDIIFQMKNPGVISSEVIFLLLLKSISFDHDADTLTQDIDVDSSWIYAIQRNDDVFVEAVEKILCLSRKSIYKLAHAQDSTGRNCKDIAGIRCKEAINRKMYLYERYEIKEGPPEHRSATSLVVLAIDHDTPHHNNPNKRTVALKFMCNKIQFEKETQARKIGNFNEKFVLPIINSFNGDNDNDCNTIEDKVFREDSIIKGYESYPYCIVMEAATQSLKRVIDHENISSMGIDEIRQMMRQLTLCLDHIHKKDLVHGDIKPLNILQRDKLLTLTDLDASSNTVEKAIAGSKTSSGYLPPEMFWIDAEGIIKIRTPPVLYNTHVSICGSNNINNNANDDISDDTSQYEYVLAHASQDMWALGCVFYQLCTGCTLFNIGVDDNIHEQEDFKSLYKWELLMKERKLNLIKEKYARNLLSQLLNKEYDRRPCAERVLMHPFFTGKACTRLPGERAAWDIFLSYRVDSDSDHVEMLYHALTAKGLKVWWDKKCLLPGQPWEEGFCSGLISSIYFVCLLSRGSINHDTRHWQNFEKLQCTSPCDNVLLEWRLALELRERGMISGIYPVMIGDKDPVNGEYSNYFKSNCNPVLIPDIVIESVESKLSNHLEREGFGLPYKSSDTAKNIVNIILSNQGGFIEENLSNSIENITNSILSMTNPHTLLSFKNTAARVIHDNILKLKLRQQKGIIASISTELDELKTFRRNSLSNTIMTMTSSSFNDSNDVNFDDETDRLKLKNDNLTYAINTQKDEILHIHKSLEEQTNMNDELKKIIAEQAKALEELRRSAC